MTRYRFPEALGGGEYDAVVFHTDMAGFDLPGLSSRLWLEVSDLTVVEPPLPPEPPLWSVVLDVHRRAWQHVGDGRGEWDCAVDDLGADWDDLNRDHGPTTLLVPDPFAVPVELPWTGESSYGTKVEVLSGVDVDLRIHNIESGRYVTASFKPEHARDLSNVLRAAADQAEATP